MDEMDSQLFDFVRRQLSVTVTGDLNDPGIRSVNASQDFDQGRFTGSVLPDQAVNRPLTDLQVGPVQGPSASERLDDIGKRNGRLFLVDAHSKIG